jgi:hypothetical protein
VSLRGTTHPIQDEFSSTWHHSIWIRVFYQRNFRKYRPDTRMASMKKQVIRPLKKYSWIEPELSVQVGLISEARWIGTASLKNSKRWTNYHSLATLAPSKCRTKILTQERMLKFRPNIILWKLYNKTIKLQSCHQKMRDHCVLNVGFTSLFHKNDVRSLWFRVYYDTPAFSIGFYPAFRRLSSV